jgi:hypothetical protein
MAISDLPRAGDARNKRMEGFPPYSQHAGPSRVNGLPTLDNPTANHTERPLWHILLQRRIQDKADL